ncbi:MAG: LamG domain-containing protein [Ruminococcaceae bacterium]|nr:LamG domain-containing protein [Oscillospiraceae bacterium]
MKKLLIIAILMLAMVMTVVACTDDPATTETTDGETTAEVTVNDETTAEEVTTEEVTTEEVTTEEVTTEEVTTEEVTTEEVTEAPKPLYPEIDKLVAYLPLDKKALNKYDGEGALVTGKYSDLTYDMGFMSAGATPRTGCITVKNWKPDGKSFAVSMWINTTVSGGDSVLVGNKDWNSGGNPGFLFCLEDSNIRFNIADGQGHRHDPRFYFDSNLKGTWMYVVMVVDRTAQQVKVSYNFNEFQTWDIPDELKGYDFNTPYEVMNIGNDGTGNYSGLSATTIDEVLIFNDAITMEEVATIAAHYDTSAAKKNAEALANQTIAYLPLDKKVGNKIDSNIVTQRVNAPDFNAGYKSAAYSTGANGYFNLGENWKPGTDSFSVGMWFKGVSTSGQICLLANQAWGPEDMGFVFVWYQQDGQVRGVFNFNGVKRDYRFTVPADYLDRWMYITIVVDRASKQVKMSFDFGEFQVYDLDGAYDGASFDSYNYDGEYPGDSKQSEIQYTTYRPVAIGNDGVGGRSVPIGNLIDEVLVFDKAVTLDDLALIKAYYTPAE